MTGARPDTWMPVYIGDYLADTMHLSYAEHGAYMLLIFAYWRSGEPLPDDDRALAGICKASARQWRDLRPTLSRFFQIGEGIWRHKRIEEELVKWQSLKDKRSGAGASGAAKRWQTHGKRMAKPVATEQQNDALNLHLEKEREAIASPKKKATRARSPIDPERQPDEQERTFAEERGVNVDQEWPRFINHHVSHGTLSADWRASWRTWCLNDVKFAAERRAGRGPKSGGATGFAALLVDPDFGRGFGPLDEAAGGDAGDGPIIEGVAAQSRGVA